MSSRLIAHASVLSLATALALVGSCQKVAEPVPILTQNQWQRIQEHIFEEPPAGIQHEVGAVFGGLVELVGYNIDPEAVETGEEFTVTWYWRVLEEMEDRWEIFVHLDRGSQRQNLDHEAVGGLYTALRWEPGQVIQDIQTQRLAPNMGSGEINVYLGFWRRVDEQRLPVSRAGNGTVQPDGRLLVGSFEARRHVVRYEASYRQHPITIDGALRELDWRSARQTDAFVQPNDGSEVEGARTQAQALWDREALYIGLSAVDRDIWATYTEDDTNLWEEEVLEVYLDPRGDGRNYLELQVNPLGAVFDARFAQAQGRDATARRERQWDLEGLEAAVQLSPRNALESRDDTDRRWTVEMRIPWASLPDFGPTASSGDVIAANFYRYDRPDSDTTVTAAWSPVYGGSFHQPDKFGEIVLVGHPPENEAEGATDEAAEAETPEGTGAGVGPEAAEGTGAAAGEGDTPGRVRRLPEGRSIVAPQLRLRTPVLPQNLRTQGTSIRR